MKEQTFLKFLEVAFHLFVTIPCLYVIFYPWVA